MNPIENYLQKAWSDGIANVNIEQVKIAIEELKQMDDEHGAIWVSVIKNDENIVEVHKDLTIIIDFENQELINTKLKSWEEAIEIYKLLLEQKFNEIIKRVKSNF